MGYVGDLPRRACSKVWSRFTESEGGETALAFVLPHSPNSLAEPQGLNMF
jgi:hypothetical protein